MAKREKKDGVVTTSSLADETAEEREEREQREAEQAKKENEDVQVYDDPNLQRRQDQLYGTIHPKARREREDQ